MKKKLVTIKARPVPVESRPPVEREEIVALARRRWQEAGSPVGSDEDFWFAAESELHAERENVAQTLSRTKQPASGTP